MDSLFLFLKILKSFNCSNIKWFHTFHSENSRFKGFKRKMNYLIFKNCNYLIGVSKPVSSQWMEFLKRKDITTINNGISSKDYSIIKRSSKCPNNQISILWVGRLEKVKNPLMMIEALDKISLGDKEIESIIIGNGSLLDLTTKRITTFNAHKKNKNIKIKLYSEIKKEKRYLKNSVIQISI